MCGIDAEVLFPTPLFGIHCPVVPIGDAFLVGEHRTNGFFFVDTCLLAGKHAFRFGGPRSVVVHSKTSNLLAGPGCKITVALEGHFEITAMVKGTRLSIPALFIGGTFFGEGRVAKRFKDVVEAHADLSSSESFARVRDTQSLTRGFHLVNIER